MTQEAVPRSVLQHWSRFAAATPAPFGTGLINKTFLVESGGERAVMQRLHPVFAASVNVDIDAVTRHLAAKGLVTPRVLPTDAGALSVDDPDTQRPWRMLSYVDGRSVDQVTSPELAHQAGALVARFHVAVSDLQHNYHHVRPGVHDTSKHLNTLKDALTNHPQHRLFGDVQPVAQRILDEVARLPDLSQQRMRHCHGDLKISNLLFDAHGTGLCLVDLDTLGRMALCHELGDALRSWTNPAGEDVTNAEVDVAVFAAAVSGYASVARDGTSSDERTALVSGVHTICLELAARFCADALNESYFGFNAARFDSRGAHNLVRAKGQLALADSVAQKKTALESAVLSAFG